MNSRGSAFMIDDVPRISDARLNALIIPENASIRDAMEAIDRGANEVALVVSATGQLLGTVSDGDVRRALLRGDTLADPVLPRMEPSPQLVTADASRAEVLDLMRARSLAQIPIVDTDRRLLGMHVLRELIGGVERPNTALLMAGGRGTRLGELTSRVP